MMRNLLSYEKRAMMRMHPYPWIKFLRKIMRSARTTKRNWVSRLHMKASAYGDGFCAYWSLEKEVLARRRLRAMLVKR